MVQSNTTIKQVSKDIIKVMGFSGLYASVVQCGTKCVKHGVLNKRR